MGKPRRCSSVFFAEERALLEFKRKKIRQLQQQVHQGMVRKPLVITKPEHKYRIAGNFRGEKFSWFNPWARIFYPRIAHILHGQVWFHQQATTKIFPRTDSIMLNHEMFVPQKLPAIWSCNVGARTFSSRTSSDEYVKNYTDILYTYVVLQIRWRGASHLLIELQGETSKGKVQGRRGGEASLLICIFWVCTFFCLDLTLAKASPYTQYPRYSRTPCLPWAHFYIPYNGKFSLC